MSRKHEHERVGTAKAAHICIDCIGAYFQSIIFAKVHATSCKIVFLKRTCELVSTEHMLAHTEFICKILHRNNFELLSPLPLSVRVASVVHICILHYEITGVLRLGTCCALLMQILQF